MYRQRREVPGVLGGVPLAIALQLGREEQVPLLATGQAAELMDVLLAQDGGERDHSSLALLDEQASGTALAAAAQAG